MDSKDIEKQIEGSEIVPLTEEEWESVSGSFEVISERDTLISGMITLLRSSGRFFVLEEPGADQRVLRTFGDEASALRFVDERMETYERMWDGCGCRIDYFK